jgi:hypothetical protein
MLIPSYGRYFEILAQVGRRRLFWPVVFALFVLYAYLPLLNEQSVIENARSSPLQAMAIDSLKVSVKNAGQGAKEERIFTYSATPFVQVSIPYFASWDTDFTGTNPYVKVDSGRPNVSFRLDQFILAGAMIVMFALTLSTLYPKSEIAAKTPSKEEFSPSVSEQRLTARQVFTHEVKHAEFRAETLFKRSTYLLTGGVLMAFVGVVVFYATLPEPARDETHTAYLIRTFRSAGMLIFLEAIAWFLLRQYRNLIEDFKSFHRIYMKRANYLAAITVLDKEAVRSEDLLLVTALLGEDLSGKLASGETTESLENMKNEGVNPVFNLVHDALAKAFSRTQTDKSSSKSANEA